MRKKRLFRFLSNTGFDSVATQTALLAPICQAVKLRGQTPIMIDRSDLGQGRNGLFAAVCFQGRGLVWPRKPLLPTPKRGELLNRLEEFWENCCATCPPASDSGLSKESVMRESGNPERLLMRRRSLDSCFRRNACPLGGQTAGRWPKGRLWKGPEHVRIETEMAGVVGTGLVLPSRFSLLVEAGGG